jgi:hypothetical protein
VIDHAFVDACPLGDLIDPGASGPMFGKLPLGRLQNPLSGLLWITLNSHDSVWVIALSNYLFTYTDNFTASLALFVTVQLLLVYLVQLRLRSGP